MASRLIDNAPTVTRMTKADLQAWCEERNANSKAVGEQVWHFVAKERVGLAEQWAAKRVEGWKAKEMRAAAEGRPINYFKPRPGELELIRGRG